jgi:LCP family protein required for cell wall assembly
MSEQENKRKTSPVLVVGLIAAFLIAAFISAYFAYTKSHDFWVSYDVTNIGGLALKDTQVSGTDEEGNPVPTEFVQTISGPTPQPWDGASRVTMLVMGLDFRDWASGDGPPRTDTMILLTVDPLAKTAGILNIPRDLWVNIPGFDHGKINTAYSLGEAYDVPGGGPGLAVQTVEHLLGVPIHYYAQIDFYAFERFVNHLGSVEIDVPYEIRIDPIGKYNTVILQPGKVRLEGPELLAYARARNSEGGDFDRAQRQQQVILALRRRILKPEALAWLIPKAPELYAELSDGIRTNISLEEAIKLGLLAQDISLESIKKGTISPPDQVLFAKSPDGALDILKPIPDKIRLLRDEIFATNTMLSPGSEESDMVDLMQVENARIVILNGTYTENLAGKTQDYIQSNGANVISTGNAEELPTYTKIYDYTGNPYTLSYLVELMEINPYNIYYSYDPNSEVDVLIILGADWANNNPMQ